MCSNINLHAYYYHYFSIV